MEKGEKNKISVIMAVYKEPLEYLKLSIDSILTQSYSNLEFLIINDNPEDNILDSFIRSCDDPRIKYYRNDKNLGLASCLNNLIRKTSGEFIARMDADDISHKDRFEKQLAYLRANKDVYVLGSFIDVIDSEGRKMSNIYLPNIFRPIRRPKHNRRPIRPIRHKDIEVCLFIMCPFHHSTVIFRSGVFFKYDLFYRKNFRFAEDYELWSRLVLILKVENLKYSVLKYRFHKNQISSNREAQLRDVADIRKIVADYFLKSLNVNFSIPTKVDLFFIKELEKIEKSIKNRNPSPYTKIIKRKFAMIRLLSYISLDKYTISSFFYFLFSFNYLRYPRDLRPTLKIILKHFFSRRRWHKFY